MKSRPGKLADYRQTRMLDGGLQLIGPEVFIIGPGIITHFLGDHRIYRCENGQMVPLNGPLGGGVSAPDPLNSIIDGRWPGLRPKLAS